MRYSSGVVKPDGVAQRLEKEIFQWMEEVGLMVVFQKRTYLRESDVRVLYEYCYGLPHYDDLELFLLSGPVVFYVVSSETGDAIKTLNDLVGPTDPKKASKGTIRGRYGINIAYNIIHSTQDEHTLKKELAHFLNKEQLLELFL